MTHETKPVGDSETGARPDWTVLYQLAAAQAGHFTTAQAAPLGFSDQLLSKHVRSGNLERDLRGVYRIIRFPPAEQEDLVVAWLWSDQQGVISHETALQLHGLSDALPARIHLTLPESEKGRRRVAPQSVIVHFGDVPEPERVWIGPVPVTRPARTVRDVAAAHGDADLVAQAIEEGIRQRSIGIREVAEATAYVAGFRLPAGATRMFPKAVQDLADQWTFLHISGRGARPPPADWPTIAEEVVRRRGGRVYSQQHFSRAHLLLLQLVWPAPGPDSSALSEVRTELAKAFSWQ